ncbi:MAG TPA: C4-type zinc ribbon domain-containing protein [bacterium]|nr:C4-type zinc ribbon domain-containing protein [bacterium]
MSELYKKLSQLYGLQMIDNEIIANTRWIKNLDREEDPIQKKHRDLQEKIKRLDKEQEPFKSEADDHRAKIENAKAKKKEIEDKLFDPGTDPKDLQYLQKEREQYMNIMKNSDNEIVKLMVAVENIEIKKSEVKETLKGIEGEFKSITEDRENNKEDYLKKIEELKQERKSFKDFEDRNLLTMYQELQRERDGVAIATVEEGVCTGCNVEVSRATLQKLEYGDVIVKCQRCGRILFVPEQTD